MGKQKEVKYVVGTTLDAKPITVTHVLVDDNLPKEKSKTPVKNHLKGGAPVLQTTRKTCTHAQEDARKRHQAKQNKK